VAAGLAAALLDLQELTQRLRRDCPWDREQTVRTIVPHTVEEAYEVADAAIAGDDEKLVDELGDLLFQVYFLALLLEERGEGDLGAVARGIHAKLVRRHPHVFGDVEADTPERVKQNWEQIKRDQEGREGIFHDIPDALPALLFARKAGARAASAGFDYPDAEAVFSELDDETRELRQAIAGEGDEAVFGEVGDVLFAGVNLARKLGVDPELALRGTVTRFRNRVETAETLAAHDGKEWTTLPLEEQDLYFDKAKETE
jgi:MazG family protein